MVDKLDRQNDLFISYGHVDNEPVAGQPRWVTYFHEQLRARLAQLLGVSWEELQIYRDERLQENDLLTDEICSQLNRSAALAAVLTPRYLNSRWCQEELRLFCERFSRIENRAVTKVPLFLIKKTPIDGSSLPDCLPEIMGYEFYDSKSIPPKEFPIDPRDDGYLKFREAFERVAFHLCRYLKQLRSPTTTEPVGVVYVAETTAELNNVRLKLVDELEERGYLVLPNQNLSTDGAHLRPQVETCLHRARLSIHLLGRQHALVPEGDVHCKARLQLDLAAGATGRSDLHRIIWVPEGTAPSDPRQAALLEYARQEFSNQRNTDVLEAGLSELKQLIHRRMNTHRTKEPAGHTRPSVYVLSDIQDSDLVQPVHDYIHDRGCEVRPTVFDGSEAERLTYHQAMLQQAEGALIYWGLGSEAWMRTKLGELSKALGLGRPMPFLANAVLVGTPSSRAKDAFKAHGMSILRPTPATRDALLSALEGFLRPLAPTS
ncbi:hypothetical protein YTPLAS18_17860 [Nitrospira sp.]|nr:hypothetical protein YTPLAS18_17860 [Nitrospira sp.]